MQIQVTLYMVLFQPTEPMEPARIKPVLHAHYGLGLVRVLPLNPVTHNVVFNFCLSILSHPAPHTPLVFVHHVLRVVATSH